MYARNMVNFYLGGAYAGGRTSAVDLQGHMNCCSGTVGLSGSCDVGYSC